MRTITKEKINQVVDKIVKEFKPEKVILFGSYAWGEPNEDSDVDLFVVKETENSRIEAREISGSIFPRPFPIDLIVYSPNQVKKRLAAGDFFVEDVFLKGKVLYSQ